MATTIKTNNRTTARPGAYTEVDASALDSAVLGATGVVAVLGEAEGGKPVAVIEEAEDIVRFTRPESALATFRGGQLREATNFIFNPSQDPDIPGGASEYVAMKVNPSTQSTALLANGDGDAILLTSAGYGLFTEQINVTIATGTNQGKLVSLAFEGTSESGDDIGGDTFASLTYVPGTNGYDTMVGEVDVSGNITATGTTAETGLDGDVTNPILNAAAEIVSANSGDTTQTVELFGLVGGVPTIEELSLNGTTVVAGSVVWDAAGLLGARLTGTTLGAVTIRNLSAGLTVLTLALGTDTVSGLVDTSNMYVNRTTLSLVADAASTDQVLIFGRTASGAALNEAVTLNGTTPVVTAGDTFAEIDLIVLGDLAAARTVTLTAVAAEAAAAVQTTLLKARDYFAARSTVISPSVTEGFTLTLETGRTGFLLADLDVVLSADILSTANIDLTADLAVLIEWFNANSSLVVATKETGATGVPSNTGSPVFLAGGIEGVATFADYQKALNLLKGIRVATIVDLSGDPAVAAALAAHCSYMVGIGRNERDGVVGVLNAGLTDVPTKTEYKAAIVAINSRHIRAVGQAVTRYNVAGERTEFLPPFAGLLVAGMQAGSPIGEPLTSKTASVLRTRQSSTWNTVDDIEEMLAAGAWMFERIDNVGVRNVRNLTTHLSSNNIAYIEASANEAVNEATYRLRTELEQFVGGKGFAGKSNDVREQARTILNTLVEEDTLAAWASLQVTINNDAFEVSVAMAPVIPTNFVHINVHLMSIAQIEATR